MNIKCTYIDTSTINQARKTLIWEERDLRVIDPYRWLQNSIHLISANRKFNLLSLSLSLDRCIYAKRVHGRTDVERGTEKLVPTRIWMGNKIQTTLNFENSN